MAKKILIIEDEMVITKSLQKLLERKGYDVAVTHSGKDALGKIQVDDFNLIISDVRMSEMDGIETIRRIREYLRQQNKSLIPEIIITGYADEDKYKSAVDLQVSAYIYKPFDINELLEAVKRVLGEV